MKTKTKTKKCEIYLTISQTALNKIGTNINIMLDIIRDQLANKKIVLSDLPSGLKFERITIRNRNHVVFRVPDKDKQEAINTLMLMKKSKADYGCLRDCEIYPTNMGLAALKASREK
jgi:hypothetical protein